MLHSQSQDLFRSKQPSTTNLLSGKAIAISDYAEEFDLTDFKSIIDDDATTITIPSILNFYDLMNDDLKNHFQEGAFKQLSMSTPNTL